MLANVDAVKDSVQEFPGGLYLSAPFAQDGATSTLSISLASPLTDSATGLILPADRLFVGTDELVRLQPSGGVSLPYQEMGPVSLRLGVKAALFDKPGIYEGTLRLAVDGTDTGATDVPIRVELLSWVAMKRASERAWLIPDSLVPDSGTLTTGAQQLIYVASNDRWLLSAGADGVFVSETRSATPSFSAKIRIRVLPSQWLKPIAVGYIQISSEKPTIVAEGTSTGDCPGGWLPVMVELQAPAGRQQPAGTFTSGFTFGVTLY